MGTPSLPIAHKEASGKAWILPEIERMVFESPTTYVRALLNKNSHVQIINGKNFHETATPLDIAFGAISDYISARANLSTKLINI